MGGRGTREKVLSDRHVIAEVNRSFVPVWVNVKEQHLPRNLPAIEQIPEDDRRCVIGDQDFVSRGLNRAFYAKSWIITPDGQRLLNPERRFGHEDTPEEFLQTLARTRQEYMLYTERSRRRA